jgi:pantoate--beta-alanine ligase
MLVQRGETAAAPLLHAVSAVIAREPLAQIEYAKLCDPESLHEVEQLQGAAVLALAVRFGRARLIDNRVIKN